MKNEILMQTPRSMWQLVVSLLLMFCGVFVLFNPQAALITTALILGFFFIFTGVGYLVMFYKAQSYMLMIIGILDILIGLLFVGNLSFSAQTISLIFGLWCLFIGITQIASSFELKDMAIAAWKWVFGLGIFSVLFGVLIFFNPVLGVLTITLLMGSYLIIYGLFELMRYLQGF